MPSLIDLILEGREILQHRPWPRAVVGAYLWRFAANELAQGRLSLLGLWGEPSTVHMAILDEPPPKSPSSAWIAPIAAILRSAEHHPPALRLERTANDLFGLISGRPARYPSLA